MLLKLFQSKNAAAKKVSAAAPASPPAKKPVRRAASPAAVSPASRPSGAATPATSSRAPAAVHGPGPVVRQPAAAGPRAATAMVSGGGAAAAAHAQIHQTEPQRQVLPLRVVAGSDVQPDEEGEKPYPVFAVDGPFAVSDKVRRACVLFSNGVVWIHKDHQTDTDVLSALKEASMDKALALPGLKRPFVIKMGDEISAVYGEAVYKNSGDFTELRRRFNDIIAIGAANFSNEIQVEQKGTHAKVRYEINDELSDVTTEFLGPDADGIILVAYNAADQKDGVRQADKTQQASINDPANLPEGVFTARMIFVPGADGTLLKIRLSYKKHVFGLNSSGLMPATLRDLLFMQTSIKGLITFSGPIGSGKTTLGTTFMLSFSDKRNNRIFMFSIEDPPEGLDPRIFSYMVRNLEGLSLEAWLTALKAALRVKPHLIRIGECRDFAAANTAMAAAELGKTLVLTTIHADEGLDVPFRYVRLGIPVEEAFDHRRHRGWVSQRLIPALCPHCKPMTLSAPELKGDIHRQILLEEYREALGSLADGLRVRTTGCEHCRPTMDSGVAGLLKTPGIIGRLPAVEVVRPTKELTDRLQKDSDDARAYWLKDMKGQSLRYHAWQHLKAGRVGVDEVAEAGIGPAELAHDLRVMGVIH